MGDDELYYSYEDAMILDWINLDNKKKKGRNKKSGKKGNPILIAHTSQIGVTNRIREDIVNLENLAGIRPNKVIVKLENKQNIMDGRNWPSTKVVQDVKDYDNILEH